MGVPAEGLQIHLLRKEGEHCSATHSFMAHRGTTVGISHFWLKTKKQSTHRVESSKSSPLEGCRTTDDKLVAHQNLAWLCQQRKRKNSIGRYGRRIVVQSVAATASRTQWCGCTLRLLSLLLTFLILLLKLLPVGSPPSADDVAPPATQTLLNDSQHLRRFHGFVHLLER